jgi:transposase InsO family protein
MDGRGRCHDNIFVERLWWTVKHEWVYLRPVANGIEQKRSLGEFFDRYNLRRPHQALGWPRLARKLRMTRRRAGRRTDASKSPFKVRRFRCLTSTS